MIKNKKFKVYSGLTLIALTACLAWILKEKHQSQGISLEKHQRFIKALYSAPHTLDPAQMTDVYALVASNLLYDGLLRFSSTLEIQASLAESWSTSHDGKKLTFALRNDATFQDGSPVTPLDVVASFEHVIEPKSIVYNAYDCIVGASEFHKGSTKTLSGVKITGPHTIEISLRYPFPPFLSVIAGATSKVFPAYAKNNPDFFKHPVGSGPFRFVRVEKEDQQTDFIFERSQAYYGERPKISEMVLRAVPEKAAQEQALKGIIDDMSDWPLAGNEKLFSEGQHFDTPVLATWIIGLNVRRTPFSDLNARQAFKASVDTEGFRKTFYPDAATAHGYLPPGLPGVLTDDIRLPNHKLNGAKKQPITVAFPAGFARGKEMEKFLEDSLKKQGWNVKVVEMDWDRLMKGYSNKTLQAFVVSMNVDYPDPEFLLRNFETGHESNFSGLSNSKIDHLIEAARSTPDRIVRNKMYIDLAKEIEREAVVVNLFHPRAHYWVSDCVQGFIPNILADYYIDYRKISLKSGCHKTLEASR